MAAMCIWDIVSYKSESLIVDIGHNTVVMQVDWVNTEEMVVLV